MRTPSRALYLLAAFGLHAAVLWGVTFGPPAFISDSTDEGDLVEVALVAAAEETSEPIPEPPAPEPPEPPQPEPPLPPEPLPPEAQSERPPPPPDAIPEPEPEPESSPKPVSKPPSPPKPKPAPRRDVPSAPATSGPREGTPGTSTGKPGPGDQAHATWRNRVKPAYPASARAANQSGRTLITVNVNALGQATGSRISRSSGFPSLDQAALAAAQRSTYKPRKIAGIPLPDTITVPYAFQLED